MDIDFSLEARLSLLWQYDTPFSLLVPPPTPPAAPGEPPLPTPPVSQTLPQPLALVTAVTISVHELLLACYLLSIYIGCQNKWYQKLLNIFPCVHFGIKFVKNSQASGLGSASFESTRQLTYRQTFFYPSQLETSLSVLEHSDMRSEQVKRLVWA